MFLALVLLLGHHAAAPVAPTGILAVLNANGAVQWQAQDVLPEIPVDAIKGLGAVRAGEVVVVSRAVTEDDDEPSLAFSQGGQVISVPHRLVADGSRRWLITAAMPVAQTNGASAITEGVATGAWQTAGTVELNHGWMGKRTGQGFVRMVRPDEKAGGKKPTQLVVVDTAMPMDTLRNAYRVLVIGKGGKPLTQTAGTSPNATGDQSLVFEGDFSSTSRVVLQQRPYKWLTVPLWGK